MVAATRRMAIQADGGRWRPGGLEASHGGSASQAGDAVSHNSGGGDLVAAIRKPAAGSASRREVRATAVKASGGSRCGQRVRPRQRQRLEATESRDLARGG